MNTYNVNGMTINTVDFKDALAFVWFFNTSRTVIVNLNRDGFEMEIRLNITVQESEGHIEDAIANAVGNQLEFIGIEFDAYEVHSVDGIWLSSSEL